MEDTIPWLNEHIRLYWKSDMFQCVHAGILLDPLEVNDLNTLVHDHDTVMNNNYDGPLTITGHIALKRATWFAGDRETTEELEAGTVYTLPEKGVICIDTGCGKGGKLTAMVIEGNQFILHSVQESL